VYKKDLDINHVPHDDKLTFELFQRGDTTGVFQLESAGMKRYLKELKPTVFEDIIAMVALYRPGPMQFIDDFVARKHGHKKIEYLHQKMENALANTYGVLVYQEQVMQIAKDMCGFTGGQADTLRKGVAKKKPEILAALKKDFIGGAIKTSHVPETTIEKFWSQLEAFAAYCFPKAHAACYATIAYQTAYLKAHYPAAFMAALMTSDYDDTDRLAIEINECKHMGIEVLPPDVNESYHEFAVVPVAKGAQAQIRFGMDAIKNVGRGAVEEILRAREEGGRFASIEDFLTRVSVRIANRKALESLVKAGAFDRFEDRNVLLGNIDTLLAYANRVQKEADTGQTDLFGELAELVVVTPKLTLDTAVAAFPLRDQLQWERELLGIYLSQHPLTPFEAFLAEQVIPLSELKPEHDGRTVTVGGIVNDIREITTKNGQKMAFVKIADLAGELELILFPGAYQQTTGIWERDRVVLVRGRANAKDRDGTIGTEVKIMVDDGREITLEQAQAYQPSGKTAKIPKGRKAAATTAKAASTSADPQPSLPTMERVYIRLENSQNQNLLLSLKQAIDGHAGDTEVVLVLGPAASKQIIKLPARMTKAAEAIAKLHDLVGEANVKIQ
jgi:DNA polymerase-3 subunit alpha